MASNAFQKLETELKALMLAYENNEQFGSIVQTIVKLLLQDLGYTKDDLEFAFSVEPLTLDRWLSGKEMRVETYNKFVEVCGAIIAGKSQRPVRSSDTGFVTWRYQVEQEQTEAKRIWYIASGGLMPVTSYAFRSAINVVFSAKRQEIAGCQPPVKIYLYPPESEAARSLIGWEQAINVIDDSDPLRGSIIGIAAHSPICFALGLRVLLLEKETAAGEPYVKGYINVPLQHESEKKLLLALDPLEKSPDTPWLGVRRSTVEDWIYAVKTKYDDLVNHARKEQAKPFEIHYLTS